MVKNDDEEVLAKKIKEDAEKALDRKAKATVQWNYNCSIRMAKKWIKKQSTLKQIKCEKCGKNYTTNRDKKMCFDCEKKIILEI
ncbi:MAG: hypothetical protein FJ150_01690 [Euryarchaeota archaeon]|nr:hypothetical protein [Euryarchaeota archaeon]